ncbi:hypothetical protein P170DRAFT_439203 [Aspergillus steynii IBT 23096]|uniref:Uncharacterized protein n=1 Tax=Aspergillus steynii IBT 23096 TaxID=1392250 RepID=A0A2I2FXT1_9EURO|nr:uncharacterized protein P170DRAFT_439203 [Aspergillus steynii IBT 23096]PLB45439.1 hypothetical protein P170DRAFT_439203 [Aspergillus steynii IBT 23096]
MTRKKSSETFLDPQEVYSAESFVIGWDRSGYTDPYCDAENRSSPLSMILQSTVGVLWETLG